MKMNGLLSWKSWILLDNSVKRTDSKLFLLWYHDSAGDPTVQQEHSSGDVLV